MKPVEIQVKNFLGIEEIEYSFEPGVYVIVGRNGSGKSSFFEAIHFALFGEAIRGSRREKRSLVKRGERTAKVAFTFDRGDKRYRVDREITDGSQRAALWVVENGRWSRVAAGVNDVNGTIRDVLGLDSETFRKIFLIPQGEVTSLIDRMGNFRDLFMKISGIEGFLSRVRDGLGKLKEEIEKSESRARFRVLEEEIEKLKDLEELEGAKADLEKRLKELSKKREELIRKRSDLEGCVKLEEDMKEAERLKKRLEELEEDVERERIAEEISNVLNKIDELEKMRSRENKLRIELKRKENEVSRLEKVVGESRRVVEGLEEDLEKVRKDLENLEGDLRRFRGILEEAEPVLREIEGLRKSIEELERSVSEMDSELAELSKGIERDERRMEELLGEREELEGKLEKLREREVDYMAAKIALSLEIGDRCPVCGGIFRGGKNVEVEFDEGEMERMESRMREIVVEITRLEQRLEETKKRMETVSARKREREEKLKGLRGRMKELEGRLREIGYGKDTVVNVKRLEREIDQKRKEMDEIRRELDVKRMDISKGEAELLRAKVEMEGLRESLEELLSEIGGLEKEVEEELGKRGIGLEEAREYRRYLRGKARVEYERVKGRLEILSERLEGIDGEKLEECRERLGKVVREIGGVDSEISRVSKELGYVEGDIARRKELEREFSGLKPEVERIERDLRIINLVSKALYVDKVWPYIFESIGRPVVEVASERIEVLTSGKFRLDLKGNEIVVIDSSGLERSAALLSGGEKTLISLILALTIAESVGGGVSLFFIDEGFAALDSVNREKVAEMVGKLEEHGKTVMFITHFEDLADKFENVIRMENGRIVG